MPKAMVFFDLETGGLEAWKHPIIELGAVVVNDQWQELESYETKVLFNEATADPKALEMNHYDPEIWRREAISDLQMLSDFTRILERYKCVNMISKKPPFRPYSVACLAGHNAAKFDKEFLTALYKRYNRFPPFDHRVRDTMQLALWYLDRRGVSLQSYTLTDLCRYFDISVNEEEAHGALYDVRLSIELAKVICCNGTSREAEVQAISQPADDAVSFGLEMPDLS